MISTLRRAVLRGGGINLLPGLVGWWSLNEASGTRADSHSNGLTLTDNNTVTGAAGVSAVTGDASQFTIANSEYLSRASESALNVSAMTLAAWVYLDASGGTQAIAGKYDGVTGDKRQYLLYHDGAANRFSLNISGNGLDVTTLVANAFGAPATATWYLVVATHDPVADLITIAVNAGTRDSASYSAGIVTSDAIFALGSGHNGTAFYFGGRLDEVAMWDRALSARHEAFLYRAGSGRAYPPREI